MTPFQISKPVVEDTLMNPDGKRVMQYEGSSVLFFSKRISDKHNLLVCSRWLNGILYVDLGFKLPHEFIEEIQATDPFLIFQHFVHNFGMPIKLGFQEKKLWMFESILVVPGPRPEKIIEIINPKNKAFIQCMLFRVRAIGNARIAECALVFCINKEEYRSWLELSSNATTERSLLGSQMEPNRISRTAFYELQRAVLEEFFGKDWFQNTTSKDHPAYVRWLLCNKMIEQNAVIRFPEQNEEIFTIGRVALDCAILTTITKGDLQNLKLGSLVLYGDDAVQKKVKSRISDPEFFEDLMVEFYTASWHMNEKYSITPLEVKSFPDFRVKFESKEYFIECKHLTTDSKNRIHEVIKDANNQIRHTGEESVGILIIDVSAVVGFRRVENDALPAKLEEILGHVQASLRGEKNRAIISAVVVWDDYMQLGEPPAKTAVAIRRRQVVVLHDNRPPGHKIKFFQGQTVLFTLSWSDRPSIDKNSP